MLKIEKNLSFASLSTYVLTGRDRLTQTLFHLSDIHTFCHYEENALPTYYADAMVR